MRKWGGPRDYVGYGGNWPDARWPNNARVAVNIVINYEEGSEYSFADGDGFTENNLIEGGGGFKDRDLAAESMYEYGARVGWWRIHRILSERGVPATVYGCALALERNQAACESIRRTGWDVCSHGWRWIRHNELTLAEEREHIRKAVESIRRTCGERPLGWYCRYGPSVNTRDLLCEDGGFLYDSDSYADELPYWLEVRGRPHLIVPYGLAANDTKFVRGAAHTADDVFEYVRDHFDMLYREGARVPKMMSVGIHLRLTGHPGRAAWLERFIDHVQAHRDAWICRRIDIARHWITTHPPDSERAL
jgi:peptidoglycan/xylan/chitin deacetylase (PgdA/CDA1 family)